MITSYDCHMTHQNRVMRVGSRGACHNAPFKGLTCVHKRPEKAGLPRPLRDSVEGGEAYLVKLGNANVGCDDKGNVRWRVLSTRLSFVCDGGSTRADRNRHKYLWKTRAVISGRRRGASRASRTPASRTAAGPPARRARPSRAGGSARSTTSTSGMAAAPGWSAR